MGVPDAASPARGSPADEKSASSSSVADGFVVLVVDPVTGHCDCYGPYRGAVQAHGQAEWRRLDFDIADLARRHHRLRAWRAKGDRLTDTDR